MKKSLILLLLLTSFVSFSFPAVKTGEFQIVVGGTTGPSIYTQKYELNETTLKWDLLDELSFAAKGIVGTIFASGPNNQGLASLKYTYVDNGEVAGSLVTIDYDNFTVLNEKPFSVDFGGFSLSGFETRALSGNRIRFAHIDDSQDVVTQKTRNGISAPFGMERKVFDNNATDRNVATSFEWGGTRAAQSVFDTVSGDFFADIQNLSATGKPTGNPVRFSLQNDLANIKLGAQYTLNNGSTSYTLGLRFNTVQGTTHKTRLELGRFDGKTNLPLQFRVMYDFKRIPSANAQATFFNTDTIYDIPERKLTWFLHYRPKGNVMPLYAEQINPETLGKIRGQVLIAPNSNILKETGRFYGLYANGFYYDDDDDY